MLKDEAMQRQKKGSSHTCIQRFILKKDGKDKPRCGYFKQL